MKKIYIAGNILADKLKIIDSYPKEGMLAKILGISKCVGGCVPNTSISIAKMKGDIEVYALGKLGRDEDGEFVEQMLKSSGVDTSLVGFEESVPTAFTDVLTVQSTGNRTFFYNAGASNCFSSEDIDVESLDCDIFHIGYILLLDRFDEVDDEYGTKLARLLCQIQKKGIKTSIDVVSENSDRFKKLVSPALKFSNYAIVNEIEAGEVVGILARDENDNIDKENIKKILRKFFELGVKDYAIIHSVEGGYLMNAKGEFTCVPSLNLPKDYIKSSVGAGDSFCAGALYGIAQGFSDEKILRYASLVGACNLSGENSISGIRQESEIWKMEEMFERRR